MEKVTDFKEPLNSLLESWIEQELHNSVGEDRIPETVTLAHAIDTYQTLLALLSKQ